MCTARGFEQILQRHVARLQPLSAVLEKTSTWRFLRSLQGKGSSPGRLPPPLRCSFLRPLCRKSHTTHPPSTCDAPEHGAVLTSQSGLEPEAGKLSGSCVPAVGEHVDGTRVAVEAAHALARRPSRDDVHLPAQRHARLGAPLPHERRQLRG